MIIRRTCLLLIFIVCVAAICGCAADKKSTGDMLPVNQYVAMEEHYETYCTLINGSYDMLQEGITPPGVFCYDGSENGSDNISHTAWEYFTAVRDNYYPQVNDSFQVLLGTTFYREISPVRTVTGVRIGGIYDYPYAGQSGFVLTKVDKNGIVYGSYNNTTIMLRSGEQWLSPVTTEIKRGNATSFNGTSISYTARFDSTWTIANLGTYDKSKLTRYNNSDSAIGYNSGFSGADPAGD